MQANRIWLLDASFFAAVVGIHLIACGSSTDESVLSGPNRDAGSSTVNTSNEAGASGDGINTTGNGAGTGAKTGLPCDIQQLLENRCIGCHLGPSPAPLLTYDDLLKPSADPTKNLAQKALERMKSATSPMPPAPAERPTADEIATMGKWVASGTPKGAECTPAATADGGVDGGATNPYNTPTVCTSKTTWNGGNRGSGSMRPGGACITCHTMQGGPAFSVAGTVYPTAHEPNDCNGLNGTVTVVITDANGATINLTPNSAGNFYSRARVAAPFHVKVKSNTGERAMSTALTAGDCNSCHTEAGANGAPGRVMAP